ncbi:MAG TPA: HAD family hydrolase [Bacteroidales bacterium]|nr:HAD family hydrolase [Bacteroidales bacterium]
MQFDSLIFDMDGTLWDNVNSYVKVWNIGLEQIGHSRRVIREELLGLMGKDIEVMLKHLVPESPKEKRIELMHAVFDAYDAMGDNLDALIFPNVLEGMKKLSKKYKLLLLSNCEEGGLVKFMRFVGIKHLITDYQEHGQNFLPKNENLQLLIKRNNLKSTIYIGDTDSDSRETRTAGLPFAFAAYGFGHTEDYDLKFDSFEELTDYFMNLDKYRIEETVSK